MPGITTEELATYVGIKPASIRSRLCKFGHYFGLRPQKLINGRLIWPRDAAQHVVAGGQVGAQ
jgi:hypothetical protein